MSLHSTEQQGAAPNTKIPSLAETLGHPAERVAQIAAAAIGQTEVQGPDVHSQTNPGSQPEASVPPNA